MIVSVKAEEIIKRRFCLTDNSSPLFIDYLPSKRREAILRKRKREAIFERYLLALHHFFPLSLTLHLS